MHFLLASTREPRRVSRDARPARDRWILGAAAPRNRLDPPARVRAFVEEEPDGVGRDRRRSRRSSSTNRECPWRCLMCDLWRNTLAETRPGRRDSRADPPAARAAAARRWIKLYNAGSFFDPRAIPPEDYPAIAGARPRLRAGDRRVPPGARRRARASISRSPARIARGRDGAGDGPSRGAAATEQADDARASSAAPRGSCADRRSRCAPSFSSACRSSSIGGCRLGLPVGRSSRSTAAPRSSRSFRRGRETARWTRSCARASSRRPTSRTSRRRSPSACARAQAASWRTSGTSCASPGATPASSPTRDTAAEDEPLPGGASAACPAPPAAARAVKADFDVAVVGSGFAGSLWRSPAGGSGVPSSLVEKGIASAFRHRRVVLAAGQSPPRGDLRPLRPRQDPAALQRGDWQRARPEIACGLKRGFTFYGHRPAVPSRPIRSAAISSSSRRARTTRSPTRTGTARISTRFSPRRREERAPSTSTETRLDSLAASPSGGWVLEGERGGRRVTLRARFVADATGPGGFLHRSLGLAAGSFAGLPRDPGALRALCRRCPAGGDRHLRIGGAAALPGGRRRGPPRLRGRLDLGSPVQQRRHERRRLRDTASWRRSSAFPAARRHGAGSSPGCPPSRASSRERGRSSRSSTVPGSRSEAPPPRARTGRSCRRPRRSWIRSSRPVSR